MQQELKQEMDQLEAEYSTHGQVGEEEQQAGKSEPQFDSVFKDVHARLRRASFDGKTPPDFDHLEDDENSVEEGGEENRPFDKVWENVCRRLDKPSAASLEEAVALGVKEDEIVDTGFAISIDGGMESDLHPALRELPAELYLALAAFGVDAPEDLNDLEHMHLAAVRVKLKAVHQKKFDRFVAQHTKMPAIITPGVVSPDGNSTLASPEGRAANRLRMHHRSNTAPRSMLAHTLDLGVLSSPASRFRSMSKAQPEATLVFAPPERATPKQCTDKQCTDTSDTTMPSEEKQSEEKQPRELFERTTDDEEKEGAKERPSPAEQLSSSNEVISVESTQTVEEYMLGELLGCSRKSTVRSDSTPGYIMRIIPDSIPTIGPGTTARPDSSYLITGAANMLAVSGPGKLEIGAMEHGATPLFMACKFGQLGVVEAILSRVKGLIELHTLACELSHCPLTIAASRGHFEVVKALLTHEAIDPNNPRDDEDADTALIIASRAGHTEVVMALLAHKNIDPNASRMTSGATALSVASKQGHIGVVKALLEHEKTDANLGLVLPVQVHHSSDIGKHKVGEHGILRIIPDTADATDGPGKLEIATQDDGATPLFLASEKNHTEVVELLLAHDGVDPNRSTTDLTADTPLVVATRNGNITVVKALLAHPRIKPNKPRMDTGTTALWKAAQ
jgi:hypothetical protein